MSDDRPKSSLIANLLVVADAFRAREDWSQSRLSKELFDRGGQLSDMVAGRRDLHTGTYERVMQWFSDHWPEDAPWPEEVARPTPGSDETSR